MPTRAQAEEALVGPAPTAGAGLVGLPLSFAGLDVTGASPIVALAPAISEALMECGVTPADVTAPSDADFASLTAANWPKFLAIASFLLLEQATPSFYGQVKSIQFEDFQKEYFGPVAMSTREDRLRRRYGYGGGKLTAGYVDNGSAQTNPLRTELLWPWN